MSAKQEKWLTLGGIPGGNLESILLKDSWNVSRKNISLGKRVIKAIVGEV